ncbi:MAG: putative lipid II flippase FtsW [candidate division Zixibacteria bacterium]|nr:putative lipid II flippase FtsW [candidate division Zixibacteria bacterium]
MIDRSRPDYFLLLIVTILIAVGVVMVYSASAILALERVGSSIHFAERQAIWAVISLGLILLLIKVDYHRFGRISALVLLVSFALLALVLFVSPTRGATRWIKLGPATIQPTELFKYALILYMAHSLSKNKGRVRGLRFVILPYFVILGVASLLILKQPHLGAILLLSTIVMGMLFVAGAKIRHLLLIVAGVALSTFLLVFLVGYKKVRVDDYIRSLGNPLKGSYQMKQSVLALGSGEVLGVGLGEGKAKLFFLPEPHTDFIFATTGEELGLVGSSAILLLFLVLTARGMSIARKAADDFGYLLAFGIAFSLFAGVLINAGVVVGLLPTTGLPMPFLSYGGSSLVFSAAAIGMLLNISRQTKYVPSGGIVSRMRI